MEALTAATLHPHATTSHERHGPHPSVEPVVGLIFGTCSTRPSLAPSATALHIGDGGLVALVVRQHGEAGHAGLILCGRSCLPWRTSWMFVWADGQATHGIRSSPQPQIRRTPQISGGAFRPFCRPCRSNFCRSPAPSAASGCWTASCAFLGCPVKPGRALGAHADQTEFAESSPRTRERDQHRGRHAKPAGPLVTLGESANSWRHRTPERNREPPTPRRARHAGAALCTASRFRS